MSPISESGPWGNTRMPFSISGERPPIRVSSSFATPWRSIVDNTTIPPSVCPLYLGHVAEASDIRDALPFYRRGADYLRAWLGHEPSRDLLEALEAHEDGVAYWRGDPNGGSKAGA